MGRAETPDFCNDPLFPSVTVWSFIYLAFRSLMSTIVVVPHR